MAADLRELLSERRDAIVARFVSEIERKDLSPPDTKRSLLVDHIPRFLDEVVADLGRISRARVSLDATDTSKTARAHGEQRWNLGYDIEALVREYGVLRHCILDAAREAALTLTIDEFDILSKCLSVGVAEATSQFVRVRDEQLNGQNQDLEFLAEAGRVLSSSLDQRSTLSRLTKLLVPKLADICVIHLEGVGVEDMPIVHIDPEKGELLREVYRHLPSRTGVAFGYPQVARTGEPELKPDVDPAIYDELPLDDEHRALLRQVGMKSWIVVPLPVQEQVIGGLTLAYGASGRRHTERELILASEIARRAAVAIDHTKLYELSQNERSRVEAATRAKDEFVAMVSHELRAPLNAILGWLRLMRAGSLPPEKQAHAFDVIERNAMAQNQLVADLLDISRAITGKIRINPSQVDLANVVDLAIEGVRPAADAKRIAIDVHVAPGNTVIRGDGDRLQQVVWNLLANSVKFTGKDGRIDVRVRRVESDLELSVEDNGTGIDAGFLPHVFESFRQSDAGAARAHGGLGIGLSIAKHLVELHGGSIAAESGGAGKGATFVVRLPISPLVSTTLGVSKVSATKVPQEPDAFPEVRPGVRVLVVDDETDARELVAYVFETAGMEVRLAGSAAEAMETLETYAPHVIVSDIGMPGEDGYMLIRRIRTLPSPDKSGIPAIALTAFARNEDRTRALVEGFNLHMAKPVEPSALVGAVLELAGTPREPPSTPR